MDTTGLRIAAVAASMLDGFSPHAWTDLPPADARRVLLTDGDRTLIAAVWPPEAEAGASAEKVAAAVLAPLLSEAPFALPTVLASRSVPGSLLGTEASQTLMLAEPMPGLPLSTDMFTDRPELVESLAEALALIHSADPGPLADAGLVVEESAEMRERLLADLDTAAESGRVPVALLQRWEQALEDVSAWRFLPVPVHANLGPDALWAEDGRITGISGLGRLRVGDPAADLAAISSLLTPEDFESFFRAYRRIRGGDDPGLRTRVGFHSEITVLEWLLAALAAQDSAAVDDAVALLEALAEITVPEEADDDAAAASTAEEPASASSAAAPAAGEEVPGDGTGGDAAGAETTVAGAREETAAAPAPAGRRLLADDAESFRPHAAPEVDEDGIHTERLEGLHDAPRGDGER
ncbi:phosphotransferase [Brevibacterium salitolerans]|uniref:Aminoglycoside phosphotransferase domain-containing protein n=2 Tax=Brevibacterium TaxID=1696 RepID=A0ABN2WB56_9MICO